MRLVQLARQLGITQSDLLEFLSQQGFPHPEGFNTKIDDETVGLIRQHFQQTNSESVEDNEPIEEVATISNAVIETPESDPVNHVSPAESQEEILPEEHKEIAPAEKEVIRAKKIKLEGIKILGKIDLPEPVVKEKPVEDNPKEKPSGRKRNSSKDQRKDNRYDRRRTKPETYEQKLKKQEREAQKKKRDREKKLKDKKKKFYQEKRSTITTPTQLKGKKKKKKATAEKSNHKKKEVVYHKNPIRRLWAWLNGKYD